MKDGWFFQRSDRRRAKILTVTIICKNGSAWLSMATRKDYGMATHMEVVYASCCFPFQTEKWHCKSVRQTLSMSANIHSQYARLQSRKWSRKYPALGLFSQSIPFVLDRCFIHAAMWLRFKIIVMVTLKFLGFFAQIPNYYERDNATAVALSCSKKRTTHSTDTGRSARLPQRICSSRMKESFGLSLDEGALHVFLVQLPYIRVKAKASANFPPRCFKVGQSARPYVDSMVFKSWGRSLTKQLHNLSIA